jgi:hypothetical protein
LLLRNRVRTHRTRLLIALVPHGRGGLRSRLLLLLLLSMGILLVTLKPAKLAMLGAAQAAL